MRQPSIIILSIFILLMGFYAPAFSALKTGINYSIPIDYDNLSEYELQPKAEKYYHNAIRLKDGIVNDDMTNALMLYSILLNINPENTTYMVKLGTLYDKIGKDRHAKGNFARAISTNAKCVDAYFSYGNFYYKRESYRKALKYYNEAYKLGYQTNYDLLYQMGDIYEKFGDTRSALKYLNDAFIQSPNPDLESKIKKIELKQATNKEFYSNTRIKINDTKPN